MTAGKWKKHSEGAIEQAVSAVEDDGMNFWQASEEFGVPHSIIRDRVRGFHDTAHCPHLSQGGNALRLR